MSADQATTSNAVPMANRAERALLGALLLAPWVAGLVRDLVVPEDFASTRRATAWRCALELAANGILDPLTLEEALFEAGEPIELSEIVKWSDDVTVAANAPAYAVLVREAARRRRLVMLAHQLLDLVAKHRPVAAIISDARKALDAVAGAAP